MKKVVIWICIVMLIVCGLLIVADLMNVTGYIPLSKNYDWLAFSGAILGGLLTLLGVYFTITNQSKADKEKNRISAMPIFEYEVHYCKEDFDNSKGQLAGEIIPHIDLEGANYQCENSCECYYNLLISNVGVGHALIDRIDFVFGDNMYNRIQEEDTGFIYKIVKQNETKSFKFMIYAPTSRFDNAEFCYTVEIKITYKDLLGNRYTQLIHSALACSTLDKQLFADIHYYEPFKYIASK